MRCLELVGVVGAVFGVGACSSCADDAPAAIDAEIPAIDATVGIDADLTNPGFPNPTAPAHANQDVAGVWTDVGLADWSCLGAASADQPSTQAIALSGVIDDFQTAAPIGDLTVTAFPGNQLFGNSGMATTSNVAGTRGQYAMTIAMLPSGTTRFGFKLEAAGYLESYVLDEYLAPATATQTRDLSAFSETTANALPAFIGVTRDVSDGMVMGTMRDCLGREVSNAVVTVSTTSGAVAHLPDADSYYFSAASTSLPVRHSVAPVLNKDGQFMVLGLTPQATPAFLQVWGFKTDAEVATGQMTLLAELATPIEANAIISAGLEPKRL